MEGETGWQDSYRLKHGYDQRRATVWFDSTSFRGKSGVDEGYAIDVQLVSAPLTGRVHSAELAKPESWETRFSNHALTVGRYELNGMHFA